MFKNQWHADFSSQVIVRPTSKAVHCLKNVTAKNCVDTGRKITYNAAKLLGNLQKITYKMLH